MKKKKKKVDKANLSALCTTRKVLVKADSLLTPKSWIKGAWVRRDTQTGEVKMCAIGALRVARKELGVKEGEAGRVLLQGVRKRFRKNYPGIPTFNDESSRTFDEVKVAFSDAIKLLDARIQGISED